MARLVLSLCLALVFAPAARAASFQELEGFFAFSVSSASSCAGPGECVGIDVSLAPGAVPSNTILFDLQAAWDPDYWSLQQIVGAGAVARDDEQGFIDDLFGDVGAGPAIPKGSTLFTLIFEVVGSAADALNPVLEIGDLSAKDPFFDRAVLVADSEFHTYAPTPNSLLVVPEPATGLLLALGLCGLARRRRRAALVAAALVAIGCGDGGRVPDQRTFLWHGGSANQSPFSPSEANPFRGRVAPAKPLRLDSIVVPNPALGAAQPDAIRYFAGDPALASVPPPARIDPLDPTMARILGAPGQVPTSAATVDPSFVYLDLRGWPVLGGPNGGAIPALLSSTFPGRFLPNALSSTGLSPSPDLTDDFGGDFNGDVVRCIDPTSTLALTILAGVQAAVPNAQCIESSSTGGGSGPGSAGQVGGTPGNPANVDPGDPKGSYTAPSLVKMTGGTGEAPMRPAPDLNNELTGGGTLAQGLFIPSRGMRLGRLMRYERNVDPATGRPLVGRLDTESIGTCAAAGEDAPDALNAAGAVYNSAFASHPFSVTPGAPVLVSGSVSNRRGGVGTDPTCLRPGGAPGEANAFAFDAATLADTNALQNHHANQGVFAALCRATLPFDPHLDTTSCLFQMFGSLMVLQAQILPMTWVESLTPLLAGEQSGSAGPAQFLGLIMNSQKGPVPASQLSPVPLAGLNQLFNDPTAPFDGARGGYDGFDGRVQIPGRQPTAVSPTVAPFVTLDKALTNEERALAGCGPFYASRCDSSLRFRDASHGVSFGGFGGLDLLNGEASALLESVRAQAVAGSETSADPQPGTAGFDGPPVCMRKLANGDLVRLPGCRGVVRFEVVSGAQGLVANVEFDPGYRPSVDGCVIGNHIVRSGAPEVPVELVGASAGDAELASELARCNDAEVRQVVPRRVLVDADSNGVPDVDTGGFPVTANNSACTGPAIGPGTPTDPLRICNAQSVKLEALPLIHPTASCVDSPAHFAVYGADDCRYWMYRDLVSELLAGKAQLFRSETAALSWNLVTFMAVTSCDETSPTECFDPAQPYDVDRCSLAAPQRCRNVRGLLGMAPAQPADGSWPDADGDGVADDGDDSGTAGDASCVNSPLACDDNCVDVANTRQVNSNGLGADSDPYGNACDPDLDNDGDVDEADLQLLLSCFESTSPPPECADADLVGESLQSEPDPNALRIDGFDRLQLLRWLRSPGSVPGHRP
ncbi:MAG TPA: PEP-CTERM sorting domain-containing protein [Myxococcota bacterium]|nr:PEP-CTERM sorting domain-containing protein [Myxococcota bacterium]